MKFRDSKRAEKARKAIERLNPDENLKIMHVCGTHESAICEYGIRSILPENIDVVEGPGCPVIASMKGVDQALIVTEPTVSGIHDLERILEVAEHFGIEASVCINKYDINPDKTEEIEKFCNQKGVPVLGRIPYDDVATEAMIEEKTIIEYSSDSELSERIREIWRELESSLMED